MPRIPGVGDTSAILDDGLEGLVLKDVSGTYEAAARRWWQDIGCSGKTGSRKRRKNGHPLKKHTRAPNFI